MVDVRAVLSTPHDHFNNITILLSLVANTTHFRFSLDCNKLCVAPIFLLLYCTRNSNNYILCPQISMGFFPSYVALTH